MNIEQAQKLKAGDRVQYPESGLDKAGTGTVVGVSPGLNTNIHGQAYIWVEVKGQYHKSVWPSNRLK